MTARWQVSVLPTRAVDWRRMARTTRHVLAVPRYALLAFVAASVALTLFSVSLQLPLVELALTGTLPTATRVAILSRLYPFVGTAFGPGPGVLLVTVAALCGVDVALVSYHLRKQIGTSSGGGVRVRGAVLGALAAGVATCGPAVIAGVMSLFGVSGGPLVLPLDGLEFALVALLAVLLSIHRIADAQRVERVADRGSDPPGV